MKKTAVITGAGSGVGRAICKLLAPGMNILAVGRRRTLLDETIAEAGQGVAFVADITSEEAVEKLFSSARERFGSIDLLINCAGVCVQKRLADTTIEDWNMSLAVNATGTFLCSRAAWNLMRGQNSGHIIHIASQAAGWPGFNEVAYGTAKTAQLKFGLHLADEFRFENMLRTNRGQLPGAWYTHVICPGAIDTPMNTRLNRRLTAGQLLRPEDVADLTGEILARPDEGWAYFQTLDKPYRVGEVGLFRDWPQVIRIYKEP